jgi:hypothetical protein
MHTKHKRKKERWAVMIKAFSVVTKSELIWHNQVYRILFDNSYDKLTSSAEDYKFKAENGEDNIQLLVVFVNKYFI